MAPVSVAIAFPRLRAEEPKLPASVGREGTSVRILSVALGLFARNGFHGTSIRDLGEALGLKPASLYEHFRSKEHLLAELVRLGHEEHLRGLRAALRGAGSAPEERLAALVRAHVRMHCDYAVLAVVAEDEMHTLGPEQAAPALALRAEAEALLREAVEQGAREGVFDPPDVHLAVMALGGMGVRVAYWYRPGLASVEHIEDTYAELALRMLCRAPSRAAKKSVAARGAASSRRKSR